MEPCNLTIRVVIDECYFTNDKDSMFLKEVKELGSLEKAVKPYNFKKPHRSLTNGKLRTPYQAFLEKMRKA